MQQVKKRVDEVVGAPGRNEHSVENSLRLRWGPKVERRDRRRILNTLSSYLNSGARSTYLYSTLTCWKSTWTLQGCVSERGWQHLISAAKENSQVKAWRNPELPENTMQHLIQVSIRAAP